MSTIALDLKPITPSDSTTFTATKGLYVGVGGNIVIKTPNKRTVTLLNLAGGIVHPISCTMVLPTGTSASNILAVY